MKSLFKIRLPIRPRFIFTKKKLTPQEAFNREHALLRSKVLYKEHTIEEMKNHFHPQIRKKYPDYKSPEQRQEEAKKAAEETPPVLGIEEIKEIIGKNEIIPLFKASSQFLKKAQIFYLISYISDGMSITLIVSFFLSGFYSVIPYTSTKMLLMISIINGSFIRYFKLQMKRISVKQMYFNCQSQTFEVIRFSGQKLTILPSNMEFLKDHPSVIYYDKESGEQLATINTGNWENEKFFLGVLQNRNIFPLKVEQVIDEAGSLSQEIIE